MSARTAFVLALLLSWPCARAALAHEPSDSYLRLAQSGSELRGRWDLPLVALDEVLELDDGDGALRWSELREREAAIGHYATTHLVALVGGLACAFRLGALAVVEHSGGVYARLPLHGTCPRAHGELTVDYRAFFARDPEHRAFVQLRSEAAGERSAIVTSSSASSSSHPAPAADSPALPAAGAGRRGAGDTFLELAEPFVEHGVEHILGGLDHLLFLFVLLLPCVLERNRHGLRPALALRPVLLEVTKIATAFTLAHSLTLAAAALELVRVSATVIEPAIAASVGLSALDNLRPLFGRERWACAFALGLLHGFGFSSALSDAGGSPRSFMAALLGFNLGVELGQLAVVLAFVPPAFLVRRAPAYRRFGLTLGSLVVLSISCVWFFQRLELR